MANHVYEVVVCDMFGIAYGEIPLAVPTQVDWELDGIGSATIDFPILDRVAAELLPRTCLPGGREVQIWRDQVLIWWGWPISATFDRAQVHLQCFGILWALSKRMFGPVIGNGIFNPSFELGTNGWVTDGSTSFSLNDFTLGQPVLDGRYAARLIGPGDIHQNLPIITVFSDTQIDFSAWCYIDPNGGPFTPAVDNQGLRVDALMESPGVFSQIVIDPIQASEKVGEWNFHQLSITLTPGTWLLNVTLESMEAGWIVWDKVVVGVPQRVGGGLGDIGGLIDDILTYAQDPAWGKTPLALTQFGLPSRIVDNTYQLYDNGNILDALNEYPTAGWIDFEIVYGGAPNGDDTTDPQGHFRGFHTYEPAKGSIKWNYPIEVTPGNVSELSGSVDGSQVATAQRVLSQGTSAGAATDLGYAAFASEVGPGLAPGGSGYTPNRSSAPDASFVAGSDIVTSASMAFVAADVGKGVWSLAGALPAGAIVAAVLGPTQARFSVPQDPFGVARGALLTVNGDTVGIGGHVIENSTSQVANQTVGSLDPLARFQLVRQLAAQVLPTLKQSAEGYMGNVFVGDVLPVNIQYGWLSGITELMRVAQITLYPQTEEISFGLNVVNPAPVSVT